LPCATIRGAKHNPATKITNTECFNISTASKFAFFK